MGRVQVDPDRFLMHAMAHVAKRFHVLKVGKAKLRELAPLAEAYRKLRAARQKVRTR